MHREYEGDSSSESGKDSDSTRGKSGKATIYGVAREAGVSMATVSRVVNGNPNVRDATRKRVLAAIQRLHYRPNEVARGLARRRTRIVGVVLPDISNSSYAELARGIEDVATMFRYGVLLSSADFSQERELQSLEIFLERRVDGLLFLGQKITLEHREAFAAMEVPVVLMGMCDYHSLPRIMVDELATAQEATEILLTEGHRCIGFVGSPKEAPGECLLEQGYRTALLAKDIDPIEEIIYRAKPEYSMSYQAMFWLMMSRPDISAVLIADDVMVPGVVHAVLDAGRQIPNDISLISLSDDPSLTSQLRPLPSTVGVPAYDVGAAAMRLLTKYMHKERVNSPCITLPHHVELRDSTRLRRWY